MVVLGGVVGVEAAAELVDVDDSIFVDVKMQEDFFGGFWVEFVSDELWERLLESLKAAGAWSAVSAFMRP